MLRPTPWQTINPGQSSTSVRTGEVFVCTRTAHGRSPFDGEQLNHARARCRPAVDKRQTRARRHDLSFLPAAVALAVLVDLFRLVFRSHASVSEFIARLNHLAASWLGGNKEKRTCVTQAIITDGHVTSPLSHLKKKGLCHVPGSFRLFKRREDEKKK